MDSREILFQEELLDQLFDGAYLVSAERVIIFWNSAAEQLTGYTRQEVIGASCIENFLTHVDAGGRRQCRAGCPLQRAITTGAPAEEELFLRHKAGHRIPVLMRTQPLKNPAGETVGALEIFRENLHGESAAEKIAALQQLALMDHLTQIPNRRYLEMSLEARLNEQRRMGIPLGVLLIDLDHFKEINDTHGHGVGDEVLQMVVRTLTHCSRPMDQVGRWGGEEFLVVVPQADHRRLEVMAERFCKMVQRSELTLPDVTIKVTISIGGAVSATLDEVAQLLERADAQLYRAKQGGRNRAFIAAE